MGIAAYNRGSAKISRDFAREARPVEFEIIDRLNAAAKYDDASAPWGDVRIVMDKGVWWVECPVTGFGYWYRTLIEAVRRWNIEVTAVDLTTGGPAYTATPRRAT